MTNINKQKLKKLNKGQLIEALIELSELSEHSYQFISRLIATPEEKLSHFKSELAKI